MTTAQRLAVSPVANPNRTRLMTEGDVDSLVGGHPTSDAEATRAHA